MVADLQRQDWTDGPSGCPSVLVDQSRRLHRRILAAVRPGDSGQASLIAVGWPQVQGQARARPARQLGRQLHRPPRRLALARRRGRLSAARPGCLRWILARLASTDQAGEFTLPGGTDHGTTIVHPAALTTRWTVRCIVLAASEFALPGQERRRRHREDPGPASARQEPCHRSEPHPVGRVIPYPADIPAQHRVLVPEYEQLGVFRPVSAEHQDGQAKHPARQQVDDLEQHPASQPPLRPSCRQQCR